MLIARNPIVTQMVENEMASDEPMNDQPTKGEGAAYFARNFAHGMLAKQRREIVEEIELRIAENPDERDAVSSIEDYLQELREM